MPAERTSNMQPSIFSSVPKKLEPFFADGRPTSEIVDFLDLPRKDVARATKLRVDSVRFDERMPPVVEKWLREVGTTIVLVMEFFKDPQKTKLWFETPNPQLGGIAPSDMIKLGRTRKLLAFVQTAVQENAPPRVQPEAETEDAADKDLI